MSTKAQGSADAWRASRRVTGELLAGRDSALFVADSEGRLILHEGASFGFLQVGGGVTGRALPDAFEEAPWLVEAARTALAGRPASASTGSIRGRWYECRCAPLASLDGVGAGVVCLVTDVTSKHRADEARDELLGLLGELDFLGWRMEASTLRVIEVVGANAFLMLSAGESLVQRVYPEERDTVLALLRAAAADGRARTFVHRMSGARGTYAWYRTRVALAAGAGSGVDPRGRELVGVMLDVSERVATESALRDSETQLRMVLDQLPAIVFTTDRNLRFTFGVGAGLAELGLRGDAVFADISIAEYLHTDDPEHPILVSFRRALQGETVLFESEWLGRTYENRVEPFRGASGQIIGTLAVSWNVTQRKRAENALRLLSEASAQLGESLDYPETLNRVARATVPSLADWCVVAVIDGGALAVVASAHVDPSRAPLFDDLPPATLEALGDMGAVVRSGRSLLMPEVTDDMLTPGGGVPLPAGALGVHVAGVLRRLGLASLVVVPLVARGRPIGALFLARTQAVKHYDEHDLRVAETLARRCAVAIDNSRLYCAATAAVQARDDFLSVASHELRTPLTSILLRLDWLERSAQPGHPSPELLQRGIVSVARQARHLSDLVDNLLDISRLRLGQLKLDVRPLDLSELVRDVTGRFEVEFVRAGCSLSLHAEHRVLGRWDPLRIEQVVTNLLSNAVKHAGAARIEVCVDSDETLARIVVHDFGAGIPPEDQRRIFECFERGPAPRAGGLGLGLFIAQEIAHAHGGAIKLTSAPGAGSKFTVELPLAPADTTAAAQPD